MGLGLCSDHKDSLKCSTFPESVFIERLGRNICVADKWSSYVLWHDREKDIFHVFKILEWKMHMIHSKYSFSFKIKALLGRRIKAAYDLNIRWFAFTARLLFSLKSIFQECFILSFGNTFQTAYTCVCCFVVLFSCQISYLFFTWFDFNETYFT